VLGTVVAPVLEHAPDGVLVVVSNPVDKHDATDGAFGCQGRRPGQPRHRLRDDAGHRPLLRAARPSLRPGTQHVARVRARRARRRRGAHLVAGDDRVWPVEARGY